MKKYVLKFWTRENRYCSEVERTSDYFTIDALITDLQALMKAGSSERFEIEVPDEL